MGNPLKQRFINEKLYLSDVWLPNGARAESGFYVKRQTGTSRYEVSNGTTSGFVRLVEVVSSPGEGVIKFDIDGTEERAKKIQNRTVVTFSNKVYKWDISENNILSIGIEEVQHDEHVVEKHLVEQLEEEIIPKLDDVFLNEVNEANTNAKLTTVFENLSILNYKNLSWKDYVDNSRVNYSSLASVLNKAKRRKEEKHFNDLEEVLEVINNYINKEKN